ncbi:MAG: GNAT family N-acetyltransferase [Phycisphaerales bacterium]|nr:MAG: GNAT family N-acetyltransferase [Phycisphaerales bacterium]
MIAGYAHPDYAHALQEIGRPRRLARCKGWILEREIPGTSYRDAMGCYPVFVCQEWSALREDLDALGAGLVSLAMVPDPFGDYELSDLENCFDMARPFKDHVVVDLDRPWGEVVSKHHRKIARRALRQLEVQRCASPQEYQDDWIRLHGCLVSRHAIRGIAAFSRDSLCRQLAVPGASLFVAVHGGKVVGGALAYQQGDVVSAHLTAFDETGYELSAAYALKWRQLEYYADKARWFNLAGVPGVDDKGGGGLRRFKQGWSPETRTAYFCGRVFDGPAYEALSRARKGATDGYFPAYRAGEFS